MRVTTAYPGFGMLKHVEWGLPRPPCTPALRCEPLPGGVLRRGGYALKMASGARCPPTDWRDERALQAQGREGVWGVPFEFSSN